MSSNSRRPVWAAALILAGCAGSPQTDALLADRGSLPPRAQVGPIPFQPHVDHQGAPGAVAMALHWAGRSTLAASLVTELSGESKTGAILGLAARLGRLAHPVRDLREVLAELAAGNPVLTLQEPSGRPRPVYRYALLVGYDLKRKVVYAHSGVLRNLAVPLAVFEGNWERAGTWATVILPPDRPPATDAVLADASGR